MMSSSLNKDSVMECARHGDQRPAFICRHLRCGEGIGFHEADGDPDPEWPFKNAWCGECDKVLLAQGEWNDISEAHAQPLAICEACYEEIKQKNARAGALVRCSQCGHLHDIRDSEVSFRFPDDYAELPEIERDKRAKATPDFCQLDQRFFIRCVAPVPVLDGGREYCWGVWVEIAEADFRLAYATWDDEDVSHIPRLQARLANAVPEYKNAKGLRGEIALKPDRRPVLCIIQDSAFRDDQLNGVTRQDTLRYYHYVA